MLPSSGPVSAVHWTHNNSMQRTASPPLMPTLGGNRTCRRGQRAMGPILRASLYGALFVALLSLGSGQLLAGLGVARPLSIGIVQMAGVIVTLSGSIIALWCVLIFARIGRGTPIPLDPPRRLVVCGPYRVVRNPMAIGVGVALAGVALFYESVQFLLAVAVFMIGIHLMVMLYEEPTLRRTFGSDYVAYSERVNRWLPRLRGAAPGDP